MSFEGPKFNTEPNKSEQEPLSGDFLKQQIRLPEAEWDERFRKLVTRKIKEKKDRESKEPEESPEVLREESYRRYLKVLNLDEELLRGKKILDFGSGEGEFVKYLIDKEITQEAYGIDEDLDQNTVEEEFQNHFFQGDFRDDLPVKDADYIVSVGAMNAVWTDEDVRDVKRMVDKTLASLKKNGEIRIAGIAEPAKANPIELEGLDTTLKRWRELLKDISESQGIECRLEPQDIELMGEDNHIALQYVLVIKRKEN